MIGFAKPVLTEDLYIVQKEDFSITCYMCDTYTWRKAKSIHKRQTHLHVWHKDYDRKGSAGKKSLVLSLRELDAKMNWLAVNRQS
jgi:hypothetical protein